jgi:hypothetical protein
VTAANVEQPSRNMQILLYANMGPVMKTTVELPDELYRKAKAEAALRGRKLKDLVEEGLRLVLRAPRKEPVRPSLVDLMKPSLGIVDSGVGDLASNTKNI